MRVWDLGSGLQIGPPLTGHSSSVVAVVTTVLDGRVVAISGGDDATLRLWEIDESGGRHWDTRCRPPGVFEPLLQDRRQLTSSLSVTGWRVWPLI
ncbi:hypothetical protein [Pseudonocardia sp. GCM10023141]|uniref:hypothetical protein n=1 Tax=Pseudonocardia sp. GCM10023141 TaxID=3252653 RepID=UPI00360691C7